MDLANFYAEKTTELCTKYVKGKWEQLQYYEQVLDRTVTSMHNYDLALSIFSKLKHYNLNQEKGEKVYFNAKEYLHNGPEIRREMTKKFGTLIRLASICYYKA